MSKDNDTDNTTLTADETRPINQASDSLPETRKQTDHEGVVENNDNDQNDISVTSDETDSTDQTSDSMHRTENEAGLDCVIVSNGDNQNDASMTIDEVIPNDQTVKKTVAEGAINSFDNDQNGISLTSNEMNGTNQTFDSLRRTEKETGSEIEIGGNEINANVVARTGDEGRQTEVSNSEVVSSETEVPSAKSRLMRDITDNCSSDHAATTILPSDKVEKINSSDKDFVGKVCDKSKRCNDIENKEEQVSKEFNETKIIEKTTDHIGDANYEASDEFSTEKADCDITDSPNLQAFMKSGDNVVSNDTHVLVSNEPTIDQLKYPREDNLPGSSHEVDNNGDESQEEGDTHEVDDSFDESSEISYLDNEDKEDDSGDDNSNVIPDGDTTEDLYALLAMSKRRLAINKTDIKEDEESEGKVEEIIELENSAKSDEYQEETHHDHKSEMDEKDSVGNLNHEDDGSELSYSSATSRDDVSGTKLEQESEHPDQETKEKKKDKHNAELWALLKYSQLRLASGAIPTIAEGESEDLDIDIDEGLSYVDDDEMASSQGTADSKRVLTDIEEDEDDLSLADEDTVKEWSHGIDENARARAIAALAKVSDREVKLSDKQLKQSVKLAEEAARTGAVEFRTKNNLSALDKVQLTDKFRKSRVGNVQRSRWNVEKKARSVPLKEKFSRFKMNWRQAVDDFKKTCDRAATIRQ